jgi:hypothetical protein
MIDTQILNGREFESFKILLTTNFTSIFFLFLIKKRRNSYFLFNYVQLVDFVIAFFPAVFRFSYAGFLAITFDACRAGA